MADRKPLSERTAVLDERWVLRQADLTEHIRHVDQAVREIADLTRRPAIDDIEPIGYDGFGAPLYAHQVGPEGSE